MPRESLTPFPLFRGREMYGLRGGCGTKMPNFHTHIMASSLLETSLSTKMWKRSFSDVDHDNGLEQSEVSSASDRFFVMRTEDQTKPIDKLSPFVIDKAIKCTIGTLSRVTANT